MAVAEPTPILARSLIAQYARIPALVQTPSFLRKAKPIHLFLGASRHLSYSHLQLRGVQFSQVLFTPKRESLYLVIGFFSVRLPRSAVRGLNAVLRSTSHFTQSVYLQSLFFFHDNAFGDTSPIFLASEKKLYPPNMCWYVTHLGNLATTGHPARPSICDFSFGTLYQHHLNVSRKADWSSPFQNRWGFSFCSFLKLCISNCLFKSKGRWMRAESSK